MQVQVQSPTTTNPQPQIWKGSEEVMLMMPRMWIAATPQWYKSHRCRRYKSYWESILRQLWLQNWKQGRWVESNSWISLCCNCFNNSNFVFFPLRQIISLRVVFPFWIDIIYLCALQTTKLILAYNSCLFRYESFTGMGLKIDDVVCPMWKSQFQHQAPNLWIVFKD